MPRRRTDRYRGIGGPLDYFAYSYVDVANPVFGTNWGAGNKTNGRVNITPSGKRIIIDGTTSTNGNYYHVASVAAAKTEYGAGGVSAWILFPGGQTSSPSALINLNSMAGGTSIANPSVFGTFDPADPENDAKYNTLRHTIDFTGVSGSNCLLFNATGGNLVWNSLIFYSPLTSSARLIDGSCSLAANGKSGDNLLFENCTFDGVSVNNNQYGAGPLQGMTLTRSGSTATATLPFANTLLQTGDIVVTTGAAQSEYNIPYPGVAITVTDSTHFTYPITGTPVTPATGTPLYQPDFSRIPDSFIRKNVEFRYCGLMYGSPGTTNGTVGNVFLSGIRGVRVAGCVDFHGGWGRGITRTTLASAGGPSILTHGFYLDDYVDDVKFLDHVNGWDASNLKWTGGNYWVQNLVSVRCPMSWIFAAATPNHGNVSWQGGTTFRCTHHLQYDACDGNTSADNVVRGWGPSIYQMISGSYYNYGVLMNAGGTNRYGLSGGDQAFVGTYALAVDHMTLINWNYQNLSVPPVDALGATEANTTVTYSNCIWDNPTAGSNTKISDLSAPAQAKLTAAAARNVHTTLRTALPTFFSGVTVGGTDLETEANLLEYCCNNPIPDPTVAMSWAILFQYHARAALA